MQSCTCVVSVRARVCVCKTSNTTQSPTLTRARSSSQHRAASVFASCVATVDQRLQVSSPVRHHHRCALLCHQLHRHRRRCCYCYSTPACPTCVRARVRVCVRACVRACVRLRESRGTRKWHLFICWLFIGWLQSFAGGPAVRAVIHSLMHARTYVGPFPPQ